MGTSRRISTLVLLTVAVATVTLLGRTATSGASFTARTETPSGTITASIDWTPPTVALVPPPAVVRGTVIITANASDAETGIASVELGAGAAATGVWAALCAVATAPWACTIDTTSRPDGLYDLRAVAVDNAGYSAQSIVTGVRVDNTPPAATISLPTAPLAGTVTVTGTVAETGSGLASVELLRAPTGTTAWTATPCTVAAATTCQLSTAQVPDAVYDFALRATDVAGNVGQSAVVTREVKNRIGAVALQDPGAYLRGSATFTATASSNLGVTSVRMQRAPSADGPWTDLCSDAAAPYSCAINSATIPDGASYFRAVMVDGGGFTTTSTAIGPRTVDNSLVRAVDIQAAGNRNGLFGNGDVFLYTYSHQLAPGSILTGWDGGSRSVVVRVRNDNRTGRASDHFEIYTDNSWTTQVQVGTVEMGTDVMTLLSDDLTFNGTIVMETATVDGRPVTRVRLNVGSWRVAGTAIPVLGNHQMVWSPTSSTRDLFDIATATTPAVESGAPDNDL